MLSTLQVRERSSRSDLVRLDLLLVVLHLVDIVLNRLQLLLEEELLLLDGLDFEPVVQQSVELFVLGPLLHDVLLVDRYSVVFKLVAILRVVVVDR